jgi:two-component system sensor histidine kinase/response regulator
LRNLLQNAIKFSPSQTQISLEVKVQENFLIIQVKDEGIGINQEELSKLFTLNAKSKIGTQQEHGSGLGLILCKDYTEAQGGSISAESELGKGSTFTVCLPQELEAEEEEQVERD